MKKIINKYDKSAIYDIYQTVLDFSEQYEYEDITKYEMITVIKNHFLKNKSDFYELFSLSKIDTLLYFNDKVFSDNDIMNLVNISSHDDTLLYLIAFEKTDNKYHINRAIYNGLLQNFDRSTLEELELFKNFVRGAILTYGILLYKDIDNLYSKIRSEKYLSNKDVKIENLTKFIYQLHVEDFTIFNDGIAHKYFNNDENYYTGIQFEYDINHYLELGKYGLFYDYFLLKKNRLIQNYKFYFTDYSLTNLFQTKNNEKKINDLIELSKYEDTIVSKLILDWPIWEYGGSNLNNILTNKNENNVNRASLSNEDTNLEKEYALFFNGFLYYANSILKISEYTSSIEDFVYHTSPDNNIDILIKAIKNKNIINDFIRGNDYKMFKHYEELTIALRNPIVIEKGLFDGFDSKGRAQILNEGRCYHVTGLSNDMIKVLKTSDFKLLDITLMLLNNYVCYYFFIHEYDVGLGLNIRSIVDESYINCKHIYGINDIINIQ